MVERKIYHKHGFLLQRKKGKKWIDWQGVAGSIEVIIEMQGDPSLWRRCAVGYEIDHTPKYKE